MRSLLILGGMGILSTAAWSVTTGEGTSGQRSGHGARGHGAPEVHIKHGGGHPGHPGIFCPTEPETLPWLLIIWEAELRNAALGMPARGLMMGGPEHLFEGHLVGPATNPSMHTVLRGVGGQVVIAQPPAPSAIESDQDGAATAQPDPTASPSQARPPGAAGPGRPVPGWSGPGRPGPGRLASPRW
jgi:hypothetical protein